MKRETIAIFLVFLLIALNITFYLASNNSYSCDKCQIKFKQTKLSGYNLDQPLVYEFKATTLYESILDNSCPITWTRVGGYKSNEQPKI